MGPIFKILCFKNINKDAQEPMDLNSIPPTDWDYYHAWMQCIKIKRLVEELQEKMHSRVSLQELVEEPVLDKLGEEMHQLYWVTQWKEEDLQVKYFGQLWDWKKKAIQYYGSFKLILDTRVADSGPEYKLIFQDKWTGSIISESQLLPVQTKWTSVETFWQDTRRYDYTV